MSLVETVRSRIEEIRGRGILGQGIAAGGGIGARGIKVFGQEGEGRPLEQILERVRGRVEEVRKRFELPARAPPPTTPPTTPSPAPTATPPRISPTYTAKIKTY